VLNFKNASFINYKTLKNLLALYLIFFTSIAFGQGFNKVKKDTLDPKYKSDTIILQSDSVST
jgi:hypothetical protein